MQVFEIKETTGSLLESGFRPPYIEARVKTSDLEEMKAIVVAYNTGANLNLNNPPYVSPRPAPVKKEERQSKNKRIKSLEREVRNLKVHIDSLSKSVQCLVDAHCEEKALPEDRG